MTAQRPPRLVSTPVNRIYTGPQVPVAYDPNWQLYTNLVADQVAWFQAQPEWQDFLSWTAIAGPSASINANVNEATISSALKTVGVSSKV